MVKRIGAALLMAAGALLAFDFFFPSLAADYGLRLERWRNGLSTHTLAVGDMQIEYNRGGSGEVLLLVHGFGADKDNWTRVAGHLTHQYHVIAIDLPGFGASSRLPDAAYDIPSQVARLHQISQALGLQRFHLGGSSMGGYISLDYAARYPAEVLSLWLLAPGGVAGGPVSELRQTYSETGHNALIVREAQDFPGIMAFTMSKPPWLPFSIKHQLGQRAARDYALHRRIFTELESSEPINPRIAGHPVSSLIVWGTEDRALHVSGGAILKALLPNSRLIVRPDIGHLPMIEEPKRAAQDWLQFQSQAHPATSSP